MSARATRAGDGEPARRVTRGPRSDAERNRKRVVAAALEVFAEEGRRASVADIAARAGVGNATVYRSYRTKADLLAEVSVAWLNDMETEALRAATSGDPATAFGDLVETVFMHLHDDRLAADLLRDLLREGNLPPAVVEARRRLETNWLLAARRAADVGAVRPDISYDDLSVLILGTSTRMTELGIEDPAAWRRMAGFVRAAVAA